jgi:RecA-family ATPase
MEGQRLYRSYADIEELEQPYLWQGYIALGDVTLLAGEGGAAKGRLQASIAGYVTRGDNEMPDGSPGLGRPANVIWIGLEDDQETSMGFRLRAHGCVKSRVFDMSDVFGEDFTIQRHVPQLRQAIREIGNVKMVVIDPLSQASEKSLSAKTTVRRTIWAPLRRTAKETGTAIVCTAHTTKAGVIEGSRGLTDVARMVLRVDRDKLDRRYRTLTVDKANDADDDAPGICYTLAGERPLIRVEYVDKAEVELMGSLTEGQRKLITEIKKAGEPCDPQKVAELCGITYGNANVLLHRMTKAGLVEKYRRGLYIVPGMQVEADPAAAVVHPRGGRHARIA